jgi:hypothetical protein
MSDPELHKLDLSDSFSLSPLLAAYDGTPREVPYERALRDALQRRRQSRIGTAMARRRPTSGLRPQNSTRPGHVLSNRFVWDCPADPGLLLMIVIADGRPNQTRLICAHWLTGIGRWLSADM